MRVHIWGTDFRRSSSETRNHLFIPSENRPSQISQWLSLGFENLIYLHTCNRIELYTTTLDPFRDTRKLWISWLVKQGLSPDLYYEGYHFEGKAAVRHLLRVASSLESLVVGEPQILGQLKEAFRLSLEQKFLGDLERMMKLAFEVAKQIRTETRIAERPVSIGSLGMLRMKQREKEIPIRGVIVVGRGEICQSIIQWFQKNRASAPVTWVNRTVETISQLPLSKGVECMSLEKFLKHPSDFSHLFTATASPTPIFDASFFKQLPFSRRLVFDFAEPADVDLNSAPPIEIVRLNDLRIEAQQNTLARELAISEAEILIDMAVKEFTLSQKEAPILRQFSELETLAQKELEAALNQPPLVENQTLLNHWATKLVKRNIHVTREYIRSVLRENGAN